VKMLSLSDGRCIDVESVTVLTFNIGPGRMDYEVRSATGEEYTVASDDSEAFAALTAMFDRYVERYAARCRGE
jgi:hypothetical protein